MSVTDNETQSDASGIDAIVSDVHRCYREAKKQSSEWRAQAPRWYDLVANRQWDEEDVAALEEQKRIPVVINRVARAVNAILGTQVQNRQQTRFIPREQGDVQVNEILTGAADWVRDGCDAEDEETDAFEDTTTCGMGWTETVMGYDYDPEGAILIERIDPLEMFWDPAARKRNLADGKWFMRIVEMPRDEFETRWPDADIENATAPWNETSTDTNSRNHVYPQDAYKEQQGQGGPKKNTIRVAHCQWAHREPVYRVGQQAETLTADKFKKLKKKLDSANVPYIKQDGVTWKAAFVAGSVLLEEMDCPYPQGPTFRCITYKRDRNKNTWYGIVAAMMDPQKYGNKFLSLIMDIITKSSKGGVIIEKDAVDDPKEIETKWARPDAVLVVNSGGLNKIRDKAQINLPPGLDRLVAYFLDAVHEVTGINLELLGMANRDQPGVLETTRKQAGVTIIAPLFDGLRRYRKEQGRVLLHFIQTYISDGRLIRITGGAGNEQFVPLVKDENTAKYDVIVDEAPTSPNMKERTFAAITELLPVIFKAGIPVPPELLDYAPLPTSLIAKWKQLIQQSAGQNPQALQEQLKQLMDENQQLKDTRQQDQQKLDQAAQQANWDFQLSQQKQQADAELQQQKMAGELQLARDKAAAELQIEREKASNQIGLLRDKTSAEFGLKQEQAANDNALNTAKLKQESEATGATSARKRPAKIKLMNDPKTGDLIGANVDGEQIAIERG